MSYTLRFCVPERVDVPALPDVLAFFDARAHYDVDSRHARYAHPDTHTRFRFSWGDELAEGAAPKRTVREDGTGRALRLVDLQFELGTPRPHVCALEAEPEVAAFASLFGLCVRDPERGGMGSGPYSREAFLRAARHANHEAYRALQTHADAPLPSLPTLLRTRHWRWNLGRAALSEALGPDVVVPAIAYVRHEDAVRAAVMWSDASSIAMPDVDLVLLTRQAIARRKLFVRRPSAALVAFDALAAVHALAERRTSDAGDYWLWRRSAPRSPAGTSKPSRALVAFFNDQPAFRAIPEGLPADNVHEAEELAAALDVAR